MTRVAFVTTFCAHHRRRTFETFAEKHDTTFYFFSAGDEWYWQQQHGVKRGEFHHEYLCGFRIGGTRITPTLPFKLLSGTYDIYLKCVNGRFAMPVTYLIARLKHKPFILWTGIWMRLQTPAHRLLFPLTRWFYRHADAVVVYGEHVKNYLIAEGVASERIFVTTHAVDNEAHNRPVTQKEKDSVLLRLEIEPERKVVLYLGRLEESKGLDFLLRGFAAAGDNDAVLVLAGVGSARKKLEETAEELGISDRVRFAGYVPSDETTLLYSISAVYVLPSITTSDFKEPWGLVVNEAFNQGVPVIATDAVGAAAGGLVEDGVNGFVVPERDGPALSRALARILRDGALREAMGRNALRKIAGWDNERMVSGFSEAIRYVTEKKR